MAVTHFNGPPLPKIGPITKIYDKCTAKLLSRRSLNQEAPPAGLASLTATAACRKARRNSRVLFARTCQVHALQIDLPPVHASHTNLSFPLQWSPSPSVVTLRPLHFKHLGRRPLGSFGNDELYPVPPQAPQIRVGIPVPLHFEHIVVRTPQ